MSDSSSHPVSLSISVSVSTPRVAPAVPPRPNFKVPQSPTFLTKTVSAPSPPRRPFSAHSDDSVSASSSGSDLEEALFSPSSSSPQHNTHQPTLSPIQDDSPFMASDTEQHERRRHLLRVASIHAQRNYHSDKEHSPNTPSPSPSPSSTSLPSASHIGRRSSSGSISGPSSSSQTISHSHTNSVRHAQLLSRTLPAALPSTTQIPDGTSNPLATLSPARRSIATAAALPADAPSCTTFKLASYLLGDGAISSHQEKEKDKDAAGHYTLTMDPAALTLTISSTTGPLHHTRHFASLSMVTHSAADEKLFTIYFSDSIPTAKCVSVTASEALLMYTMLNSFIEQMRIETSVVSSSHLPHVQLLYAGHVEKKSGHLRWKDRWIAVYPFQLLVFPTAKMEGTDRCINLQSAVIRAEAGKDKEKIVSVEQFDGKVLTLRCVSVAERDTIAALLHKAMQVTRQSTADRQEEGGGDNNNQQQHSSQRHLGPIRPTSFSVLQQSSPHQAEHFPAINPNPILSATQPVSGNHSHTPGSVISSSNTTQHTSDGDTSSNPLSPSLSFSDSHAHISFIPQQHSTPSIHSIQTVAVAHPRLQQSSQSTQSIHHHPHPPARSYQSNVEHRLLKVTRRRSRRSLSQDFKHLRDREHQQSTANKSLTLIGSHAAASPASFLPSTASSATQSQTEFQELPPDPRPFFQIATNLSTGVHTLLAALHASMMVGAYLSPVLYVPRSVWYQAGIKLVHYPLKMEAIEQIHDIILRTPTPPTHTEQINKDTLIHTLQHIATMLLNLRMSLQEIQSKLATHLSYIPPVKEVHQKHRSADMSTSGTSPHSANSSSTSTSTNSLHHSSSSSSGSSMKQQLSKLWHMASDPMLAVNGKSVSTVLRQKKLDEQEITRYIENLQQLLEATIVYKQYHHAMHKIQQGLTTTTTTTTAAAASDPAAAAVLQQVQLVNQHLYKIDEFLYVVCCNVILHDLQIALKRYVKHQFRALLFGGHKPATSSIWNRSTSEK